MTDAETFAARIRRLREDTGLTRDELGHMLGATGNAIREWENGRTQPRSDMYARLADVLHTSIDYLLTGEYGR